MVKPEPCLSERCTPVGASRNSRPHAPLMPAWHPLQFPPAPTESPPAYLLSARCNSLLHTELAPVGIPVRIPPLDACCTPRPHLPSPPVGIPSDFLSTCSPHPAS